MTDAIDALVPLRVGTIVGRALALSVGGVPWLAVLSACPVLLLQTVTYFGVDTVESLLVAAGVGAGTANLALLLLCAVLALIVATGLVSPAVVDLAHGRRPSLIACLFGGLRPIVWSALLALAVTAAVMLELAALALAPGIGVIALLVALPALPGLSVLAVAVPAMTAERRGRDGFGRSAALTEGYRVSVVGALLVLSFVSGTLFVVLAVAWDTALESIMPVLYAWLPGLPGYPLRPGLWLLVPAAIGPCPLYVGTALIYVRLREIKEGTGDRTVAEVFA